MFSEIRLVHKVGQTTKVNVEALSESQEWVWQQRETCSSNQHRTHHMHLCLPLDVSLCVSSPDGHHSGDPWSSSSSSMSQQGYHGSMLGGGNSAHGPAQSSSYCGIHPHDRLVSRTVKSQRVHTPGSVQVVTQVVRSFQEAPPPQIKCTYIDLGNSNSYFMQVKFLGYRSSLEKKLCKRNLNI